MRDPLTLISPLPGDSYRADLASDRVSRQMAVVVEVLQRAVVLTKEQGCSVHQGHLLKSSPYSVCI